jgi:predicted transposase/invertase (TIGR01784 family)
VDKLVKLYLKDGCAKCILIHIEIQGYNDKDFAKRMFTYYYRILDKYQMDITAIAIFTDSNRSYQPCRYESECYETSAIYKYRTYKILAHSEEELEKLKNPFALVILSARKIILSGKDITAKLALRYEILRRMLKSGYSRRKIIHMFEFIERAVQLPEEYEEELKNHLINDKEIGIMAEEYIMGSFSRMNYNKGLREGEKRGEQMGEQKGEYKSKLEIAENLLKEKMPEEFIARVSGLEHAEILKLKKKLFVSAPSRSKSLKKL